MGGGSLNFMLPKRGGSQKNLSWALGRAIPFLTNIAKIKKIKIKYII